MGRRLLGGVLLALLCTAAPAGAATRYATPAGAGPEPCAAAAPCSVEVAIMGVGSAPGDVVELAAGDYAIPFGGLDVTDADMTIRGPRTGPRARLAAVGQEAMWIFASGITVRDVDLVATDQAGFAVVGQNPNQPALLLERVRVTARGTTPQGVILRGGPATVLRDSFVLHEHATGTGIVTGDAGATLVNVTVAAPGGSASALTLDQNYMGPAFASQTVRAVNSILRGGQYGVDVDGGPGKAARLEIEHSSWATERIDPVASELVRGPGNQSAPPLLEADGVRQRAGSPTIDAGRATALLGASDLFGGARPSGRAPDIGAHEVQEPPATTPTTSTTPATPAPGPEAAPDRTPPLITSARLARRRLAAGQPPVFRWTLTEAATVSVALVRETVALRLRRGGRLRCVAATAANRRRLTRELARSRAVRQAPRRRRAAVLRALARRRACTLPRPAGTLTAASAPGTTTLTGRTLRAGSYRATVTAVDAAGNRSAPRQMRFTVAPRR